MGQFLWKIGISMGATSKFLAAKALASDPSGRLLDGLSRKWTAYTKAVHETVQNSQCCDVMATYSCILMITSLSLGYSANQYGDYSVQLAKNE